MALENPEYDFDFNCNLCCHGENLLTKSKRPRHCVFEKSFLFGTAVRKFVW